MDQVGTERFLFDEGMSYFIEEELYMEVLFKNGQPIKSK